ncbi:PREDICTED: granzyme A-like [Nanorana parkeri]|uniref:granzyme A-like n=1 Tax=Nanorana parkeri TaxID=125878 RepID=UPI0008546B7F|nr:PREDICTED: granzyme A-like [Nanorana parkeri]
MRHIYLLSAVSFLLHISGYVCVEIIGGKEAVRHSRPYMVFLKHGERACGGALIKANWVITAAHCTLPTRAGAPCPRRTIPPMTSHPTPPTDRGASSRTQLEKNATLNKFVTILPLPNQEENVKPKAQCSTAGWGVTDVKSNKDSDVLREVNLTIVDNKVCNKAYSKAKPKVIITSSMICAGPLKKRKDDTCQGDAGGPLICDKKFTAIVSFGPKKCGNPKFPGVYTRLTNKYLTWVRDAIGGATF